MSGSFVWLFSAHPSKRVSNHAGWKTGQQEPGEPFGSPHGRPYKESQVRTNRLISGLSACWIRVSKPVAFQRSNILSHFRHLKINKFFNEEIGTVFAALDGRFVKPGQSGAPTRGQFDILPTGRNFFPTIRGLFRHARHGKQARHSATHCSKFRLFL